MKNVGISTVSVLFYADLILLRWYHIMISVEKIKASSFYLNLSHHKIVILALFINESSEMREECAFLRRKVFISWWQHYCFRIHTQWNIVQCFLYFQKNTAVLRHPNFILDISVDSDFIFQQCLFFWAKLWHISVLFS